MSGLSKAQTEKGFRRGAVWSDLLVPPYNGSNQRIPCPDHYWKVEVHLRPSKGNDRESERSFSDSRSANVATSRNLSAFVFAVSGFVSSECVV